MRLQRFKSFNESANAVTEKQVEDHLKGHYTSAWFDAELADRVYGYIYSEEAEQYDDDYVEAYKNLSTGGAVEYDLLDLMIEETSEHFGIGRDEKIESRTISDICHDHLMDTCEWHDRFVFRNKSTEPYKGFFNKPFDGGRWEGDIKL